MRSVLVNLLAAAAILGVTQAALADEPTDSSAVADEALDHNWTGFYVGAHAGYGWGDNTWEFPLNEFYNSAPGDDFSPSPEGSMAGIHAGYNHQMGRWVFGVEASYDPTTISEKEAGAITPAFPNDTVKTRIEDMYTVTARAGYTYNAWLFYAKGGWASAKLSLNAVTVDFPAGVTAGVDDRINGGTLGIGAEYMIVPHVIAGLGYDWMKLESASYSTTTGGIFPGLPFHIKSEDFELQTLMARISFKF